MGWYKVTDLKMKAKTDFPQSPILWSRGGLEGVAVTVNGLWIDIPKGELVKLAAAEAYTQEIRSLERLTEEELPERYRLVEKKRRTAVAPCGHTASDHCDCNIPDGES